MTVGHINDLRAATDAGQATDYPAEAIMVACAADPDQKTTIVLGKADTAWNPVSTKKSLTGPGTVTYTKHADGGYTATTGK
jgi:hypothetical protein